MRSEEEEETDDLAEYFFSMLQISFSLGIGRKENKTAKRWNNRKAIYEKQRNMIWFNLTKQSLS